MTVGISKSASSKRVNEIEGDTSPSAVELHSSKYTKKRQVKVTSGQGDFYSQVFKPINTALCRVTIRGIACIIERVKR